MNNSKEYYFKEGRLELSMLEDKEDEVQPMIIAGHRRAVLEQLEYGQIRRGRKKNRPQLQPKLKVSKDVYDTLHTMGQFLTGQDEKIIEFESRRNLVSSKESTGEEINSTKGKEDLEVTKKEYVQLQAKILQEYVSKQDNRFEEQKLVNQNVEEQREKQQVINQEENREKDIELYRPILENDEEIDHTDEVEQILNQNNIDYIVEDFFEKHISATPKYVYTEELKRHVEEKIRSIQNYE